MGRVRKQERARREIFRDGRSAKLPEGGSARETFQAARTPAAMAGALRAGPSVGAGAGGQQVQGTAGPTTPKPRRAGAGAGAGTTGTPRDPNPQQAIASLGRRYRAAPSASEPARGIAAGPDIGPLEGFDRMFTLRRYTSSESR